MDMVPDYIYVKDTESRFVVANRALADLMGLKNPDELLGKKDSDYFPKELAAAYFADEQTILKSGQSVLNQEERSVDAQGNPKWTSTSKVALRNKQGEIIGIIGIGRDITRSKQAEVALRSERKLLRTLIDNMPDRIYVKDAKSRWVVANHALAELVGDLKVFPQTIRNIRVREKIAFANIPAVQKAIASAEQELAGNGRVVVRYSGTEKLARVMIEAESTEQMDRIAGTIAGAIQSALGI